MIATHACKKTFTERPWSRFWTTRTSCAHLSELRLSMAPLATPFGPVPGSSLTRAKPVFGTLRARSPPICQLFSPSRAAMFGSGHGVRRLTLVVLGDPSDPQHLCGSSCRKSAASRTPCCSASRPSPTCSRPGYSCCFALPLVQTTFSVGPPHSTAEYAREHDDAVEACLSTLLCGDVASPLPATAASAAHLPRGFGGLGLRSATAGAPAAYWGFWQDSLPALLDAGMPPALAAACSAAAQVRRAGLPTPLWRETSAAPAPQEAHTTEGTLRGWQRAAASACDERAFETHLSHLDPASRALLLS